jgi:hypothetical protein
VESDRYATRYVCIWPCRFHYKSLLPGPSEGWRKIGRLIWAEHVARMGKERNL